MAAAARCSSLLLMLLLSFTCFSAASAADDEKLTHLPVYFHEVFIGSPNATTINAIRLNKSAPSFGDVIVIDDKLRVGADPASQLIGRAQGYVANASLDGSSPFSSIDFVFSDGEYSGSTLSVMGRFDPKGGPSERSIVGGTGKLRFARGYMKSRILSITNTYYLVAVFDFYFTLAH